VMDQFTRRIIGFGVHRGVVDGIALCRMFQQAIRGHGLPGTSARIMTRSIDSINGKPIFESSRSPKSKRFHTSRCRTLSWRD
jgi:hypothetical protein